MLATLMMIFSLVFTNNLVMSAVKYLADRAMSSTGLRACLVALSLIGLIAGSAISGDPVDFNQVSDLGKLLVELVVLAVGSHYSYKAIKKA